MEFSTDLRGQTLVHSVPSDTVPVSAISKINRLLSSWNLVPPNASDLAEYQCCGITPSWVRRYLEKNKVEKLLEKVLDKLMKHSSQSAWAANLSVAPERLFEGFQYLENIIDKRDECEVGAFLEFLGAWEELCYANSFDDVIETVIESVKQRKEEARARASKELVKYSLKSSFKLAIELAKEMDLLPYSMVDEVQVRIGELNYVTREITWEPKRLMGRPVPLILLRNSTLQVNVIALEDPNWDFTSSLFSIAAAIPLSPLSLDLTNRKHLEFIYEYFKGLAEPFHAEGFPNKTNGKRIYIDPSDKDSSFQVTKEDVYSINVRSLYSVLRALARPGESGTMASLLLSVLPPEFPWGAISNELLEGRVLRRARNEGDRAQRRGIGLH